MANQEHLDILKKDKKAWNQWRKQNPKLHPDLSSADLSETDLRFTDLHNVNLAGANLSRANLIEADLSRANLRNAILREAHLYGINLHKADLHEADFGGSSFNYVDLSGYVGANLFITQQSGVNLSAANLSEANLSGIKLTRANLSKAKLNGSNLSATNLSEAILSNANLSAANLSGANLSGVDLFNAFLIGTNLCGANLSRADLSKADLSRADLRGANLNRAKLIESSLKKANLTDCSVYGISTWDIQLEGAKQDNLVITRPEQPTVTVDNLKVAQFIYLLLNNEEIRDVIDTIAKKAVLILGRFTPERKAILDALREALRTHGYVPILFDFDKPDSRDLTGTISTLAHLARFIIVDLTDPSSAPHEVATVIPQTVVPVQPLILDGEREYSMFRDLRQRYHWVLPTHSYTDQAHLLATLKEHVIAPAEQKAEELEKR